jgi:hypothetical protein
MIAIFIGERILPYLIDKTDVLSAASSAFVGSTSVIFAIVTFASAARDAAISSLALPTK